MPHELTNLPAADPSQLLRFRDRQYAAELIGAALLHLDFFTWLDQVGGATEAEMCAHFSFAPRPLDVLLTLCRASGLVISDAAGKNALSQAGKEYLVKSSPWYLGPYYAPIRDTPIVAAFVKVLQSGKPGNWQAKADTSDWHASMLDETFARDFTALMNCRGMVFGQFLAKELEPHLGNRKHLLDVGAGSGIYSSALVAAHDQLSATLLEQSPVDAICRAEVMRHGLSERIHVHAADMFAEPWPAADIILFSNVLHDWDVAEARILLEKAAQTLPSGGLLVIHDAFINDEKTGPLPVAEYSCLLMNITQGKCYSRAEYAAMLNGLGFSIGRYEDTIGDRGFMTAVRN